jgi:hypothetical protein
MFDWCSSEANQLAFKNIQILKEERIKMRLLQLTSGMTVIGILFIISSQAIAYDEGLLRQKLKNVSAMEAVAIANELKWKSSTVTSYVTAKEVVFKFSNGQLTKVRLPNDRMLVAVAPYMNQTHQ